MLTVIGLASEAPESGKSTVAGILRREFGFEVHSFATPLRDEIAKALLYPPPEHFPEHIKCIMRRFSRNLEAVYTKPLDLDMRILQQWWGTDLRRSEDPEYWIKKAAMKVPEHGLVVFDDLRFLNEWQLVNLLGGQTWKVCNVAAALRYNALDNSHVSEQWAKKFQHFDALISNDGSLAELHNEICTTAMRRYPQLMEVAAK